MRRRVLMAVGPAVLAILAGVVGATAPAASAAEAPSNDDVTQIVTISDVAISRDAAGFATVTGVATCSLPAPAGGLVVARVTQVVGGRERAARWFGYTRSCTTEGVPITVSSFGTDDRSWVVPGPAMVSLGLDASGDDDGPGGGDGFFVGGRATVELEIPSAPVVVPSLRTFTTTLSGYRVVDATGAVVGDRDRFGAARVSVIDGLLCVEASVTGVDGQYASIVEGTVGRPAVQSDMSVLVGLDGYGQGCIYAQDALIAELVADPARFGVHVSTVDHPEGAVRGNLAEVPVDSNDAPLGATLDGRWLVGSAGDPDASGVVTVEVGEQFCFSLRAVGLHSRLTAIDVRRGGVADAGAMVLELPLPRSGTWAGGCVPVADPGLLAELSATPEQFYVEVATKAFPHGAIRGNLGAADAQGGGTTIVTARQGTPPLGPYASGVWGADGRQDDGVNGEIYVGRGTNGDVLAPETRAYLSFPIPASGVPVLRARLEPTELLTVYPSTEMPQEDLAIVPVTTSPGDLAGAGQAGAVFDDLGDGVPYAIVTIDAPRYGHDRIDLGPQAVADIEAARGGTFTIGLRVTSLDGGPLEELVHGGALRLVLESR